MAVQPFTKIKHSVPWKLSQQQLLRHLGMLGAVRYDAGDALKFSDYNLPALDVPPLNGSVKKVNQTDAGCCGAIVVDLRGSSSVSRRKRRRYLLSQVSPSVDFSAL